MEQPVNESVSVACSNQFSCSLLSYFTKTVREPTITEQWRRVHKRVDAAGNLRYNTATLMGSSVLAEPGWVVVKTEAIPGCLEENARPSPRLAVVFFYPLCRHAAMCQCNHPCLINKELTCVEHKTMACT